MHTHLVRQQLRTFTSLNVRSAECLDVHHFAVLIGVGATTVNAYLAQESIADRHRRGLFGDYSLEDCVARFREAVDQGLLKIISKMGIAVISSYRGGCNFEAVGLSRSLVAEVFPGMPSRISGIGLGGIQQMVKALHERAWNEEVTALPIGGFYRYRRGGETHALDGALIHMLQAAVANDSYSTFRKYSEAMRKRPPVALRDLLDFRPGRTPVSIDEVEIDHRNPQAVRDAGHVAWRALAGGARDAQHRHEPDRREIGLRRRRRGPGALPPARPTATTRTRPSSRSPRGASA